MIEVNVRDCISFSIQAVDASIGGIRLVQARVRGSVTFDSDVTYVRTYALYSE